MIYKDGKVSSQGRMYSFLITGEAEAAKEEPQGSWASARPLKEPFDRPREEMSTYKRIEND